MGAGLKEGNNVKESSLSFCYALSLVRDDDREGRTECGKANQGVLVHACRGEGCVVGFWQINIVWMLCVISLS